MSRNNVNFGDKKKIIKSGFYRSKKATKVDDIDVNKILVPKEEPYSTKNSFKYFIGYNDNNLIRPLCIKLPQMTRCVRKFEGNTTMSFKISDKQVLKKYYQIWKKVEKLLETKFDSRLVYGNNVKYIQTEMKIYSGSTITNFYSKKMPKEKAPCKSLSITMLDSVIKAKKEYPQTLLEECKYELKKIKMENLIDDDLEKRSSDKLIIMTLMMKQNLIMRKIMLNLTNNLARAKRVF